MALRLRVIPLATMLMLVVVLLCHAVDASVVGISQGCDASVSLDPRPGMPDENGALSNIHSLRSLKFIDEIKSC
ncbi:hypothetical protein PR202_ga15539 [Eleusine coracana subsp. coracana]|uniref:Uncharacterized protein n=1 Tax=Eleusine coracana subsp. coracana TaxID=191504 RepID=A0AAV5CKB5_ELECO|nr:hypothetical protein PR202_ga15539 [Eleusine coracana subsp. coracana]